MELEIKMGKENEEECQDKIPKTKEVRYTHKSEEKRLETERDYMWKGRRKAGSVS